MVRWKTLRWNLRLACLFTEGNYVAILKVLGTAITDMPEDATTTGLEVQAKNDNFVAATSSQLRHTLPRRVQPRQAG